MKHTPLNHPLNMTKLSIILLLMGCWTHTANANPLAVKTPQVPLSSNQQVNDVVKLNQSEQAERFGLSVDEWQRYEAIMQSSLGWEMQKSHPIAVLGRTAKTRAEREKYAELLVKHEYQLTEGLLAFNNARTQAWKHLYPNLPIIKSNVPERVALYASPSCQNCGALIQQWRSKGTKVDVYFVGKNSDSALRQWAMKMGIRQRDVEDKEITLNHDDGSWLTVAGAKPTPVSMAKDKAGIWSFVSP